MRRNKRQRVRVTMRPRQRNRRNRRAAAVFALIALGAAAFATVGHLRRQFDDPMAALKSRFVPKFAVTEIVAQPEALRRAAVDFLADRSALSPTQQARLLKEGFPCVASISVRRDWIKRVARLELEPRRAVALASRAARSVGYLGDDGVVFEAPRGMYELAGPEVETSGASGKDLVAAARLAAAAQSPTALPARLESLKFLSAHDGWEARLEDGTLVLWGDGRWMSEKMARLREVLADARAQADASARFSADLRYFEDGKVLLTPLAARALSMR